MQGMAGVIILTMRFWTRVSKIARRDYYHCNKQHTSVTEGLLYQITKTTCKTKFTIKWKMYTFVYVKVVKQNQSFNIYSFNETNVATELTNLWNISKTKLTRINDQTWHAKYCWNYIIWTEYHNCWKHKGRCNKQNFWL